MVLNVLRNSDVVLLVVDARMPKVARNSEIVNKIREGKRLIYVFNKIDLVGRKDVEKLREEYPKGVFVSVTKKIGVKELKLALENMAEGWSRASLRVGVVGYPNVGKSTLINFLAPGAGVKVSSVSGTTKKTQWVRSGRLRIMDSPGVIPFGDGRIRAGMAVAKDPHKIKNPEKVAFFLLGGGSRVVESIKKFYKVRGDAVDVIFEAIGRKCGYLVKGGEVDENRTAIRIIEDWQKGKIGLR